VRYKKSWTGLLLRTRPVMGLLSFEIRRKPIKSLIAMGNGRIFGAIFEACVKAIKKPFNKKKLNKVHYSKQQLNGYYSQCGQDKFIHEILLPGVHNGIFVDIGANDGINISNTYFLEKLGWTGLAIEPIPEIYERLNANRSCVTVNGCIGSPAGKRRFRHVSGYAEMLSGLTDEYDPRHEDRIAREVKERGGKIEEIEVDCFEFNELCFKHGLARIDYLSIDVEGGELAIIKSIDFSKFDIRVIGVENNYRDSGVSNHLSKHGFRFHSRVGDDFFVKPGKK
jgi:FkbM family methyltransferase